MKTIPITVSLLIVFINIFTPVTHATQVSGDVWGVWDSTMNPIEVVGELRVPPDSSLIIGPGCYIEFQNYNALTLDSSAAFIRAIGTEQDSIIFTSAPGRVWNGIDIFFADTTCEFSYCVFERSYAPIENLMSPGGAIHCCQTNLDIKNCRITDNRAESGVGGGIFVIGGDLYLSNSIISNNFCGFGGSGLFLNDHANSAEVVISQNTFENDTTYYPLGGENSGPVECRGCTLLIFEGNTIRNNLSYGVGAVRLEVSICSVTNNIISHNLGWTGRSGFWIDIGDSGTIAYNEISYNGDLYTGGFPGAGLYLNGSDISLYNNLIAFNEVWNPGGGVYIYGSNNFLVNNIIAYNRSNNSGGIYIDNTSTQFPNVLKNNIIWGNIANVNPQIFNEGNRPLEVNYCDIEGGWQGVGNIDIDPLFRDTAGGDFHLMSTFCGDPNDSPCIDVGDPTIQDYLLDCDWGLGLQLSDMGAYGGGDSIIQAAYDYQPPLPIKSILSQNYPNPFNNSTTIEFALPEAGEVSLTVYDILGRKISEPINEFKPAGYHDINIDMPEFPSGLYFYVLTTGKITISKKMVYLK